MYYTYILATARNGVLYIGVTGDLPRRMYEHRAELVEGFTKRYHIHRLVYCEAFENVEDAIAREKQLKGWRREKKIALIEAQNPRWNDLLL